MTIAYQYLVFLSRTSSLGLSGSSIKIAIGGKSPITTSETENLRRKRNISSELLVEAGTAAMRSCFVVFNTVFFIHRYQLVS